MGLMPFPYMSEAQEEGSWEMIGAPVSVLVWEVLGVRIDQGVREDLARSVSSAWIELHSKQTEACTQANSADGEVSSLMKGCEVSGIIMV